MSDAPQMNFDTLCLHAGQEPDSATNSRAQPIYQTTSYVFNDTTHAANLFALQEFGNIYTRLMNPTQGALEGRVAALEGGSGALALASGQAAESLAIMTIASAGQNIVSSSSLYGGTYNLFNYTFKRFGIDCHFVDGSDPENFRAQIDDNTRCLYAETIGNPRCDMIDLEKVADIAHEHGIPLIVDNTLASPALCRPFDYGADIVVQSLTKFMGGHGTSIGGAIVEKGDFPWDNGKFPEICEADPTYHGVKFFETFGPMNLAYILKVRTQLLRDLGPAISPFNAFQIMQGLETLHVRMPRHCSNAQAVAEYLEAHPKVESVGYAGLPSHPFHERGKKYMPNGCGAVFGFDLAGSSDDDKVAKGKKLIESIKLLSHLANVGDAKSLIIHPSSTTHQQLTVDEQKSAGVTPGLVRLSIGLEDPADIIADLDQALTTI